MISLLKFSFGNSKLKKGECIFSLPAGFSCPFAKLCKSFSDPKTGKLSDAEGIEYRCYAVSFENYRPNVRNAHWHNFNMLKGKSKGQMFSTIWNSIPDALRYRIHDAGDFFSQAYFDAWLDITYKFPTRIFYAYTKALPYWVNRLDQIPVNFKLVASYGGTHDHYISQYNLKNVRVVYSVAEANKLGLEIDRDDSHAWNDSCHSFSHLVHATQPAGTPAAKAWQALKNTQHGGYTK